MTSAADTVIQDKIQPKRRPAHEAPDIEKQRVERIVVDWSRAVSAGDRKAILAHHSDDLLMYDFPNTVRGIADYDRTWDFFFESKRGPITFAPSNLQASAGESESESVGFVTCDVHCDGTTGGPLDFRLTVGLVKRDGEWEITHEHHSLPTTDETYIPKETRAKESS